MSFAESRSHFAAWCVVSSPLVLGFDLTDATIMKTVMPLISNAKALQINQEWAGSPGFLVKNSTTSTMQSVTENICVCVCVCVCVRACARALAVCE